MRVPMYISIPVRGSAEGSAVGAVTASWMRTAHSKRANWDI